MGRTQDASPPTRTPDPAQRVEFQRHAGLTVGPMGVGPPWTPCSDEESSEVEWQAGSQGTVVGSWLAPGATLSLPGGSCTNVHELPEHRGECSPAPSAPAPALPCVWGPGSLELEPWELAQADGLFSYMQRVRTR